MWSWWLSKIKEYITCRSSTNKVVFYSISKSKFLLFFTKIDRWQHLLELIIASNVLALVLALAEAQSWHALNGSRLLQYIVLLTG